MSFVPIGVRHLILALALLFGMAVPALAQGARWNPVDDGGGSQSNGRVPRVRERIRTRLDGERPGVHLRIGGDYNLPADATVTEPIVVIGGTATVDGHAGDVVVVGGTLRIGPTAVVTGDATLVGGEMSIDPMAEVSGDVKNVGIAWPQFAGAWPRFSEWGWGPLAAPWRILTAAAAFLRLGVILIAGIVLTLVFPGTIRDVAARAASTPGLSAFVGFAGQILFFPALIVLVVILVITIVGIPLLAGLPVALAALALGWTAGFTATAARVGAAFRGSLSYSNGPRTGDFVFGFLLLTGLTLAGNLLALGPWWLSPFGAILRGFGFLVEYVAWTVGLGAAIVALFGDRRANVPPLPIASPLRP